MSTLPPSADPAFPSTPASTEPLFIFGGYASDPNDIQGEPFLRRLIARVIDTVWHWIISVFAGFGFGIILALVLAATRQHMDRAMFARLQHPAFSGFVIALLGFIMLEAIQESIHGSTLGKLCLGMVVVQEDGKPCRFGSAIIRSAAYLIDSFFFGLIAYFQMEKSSKEQRYGDQWAHTVVCARSNAPAQSLRGPGRFIAALLLGMMVDAALVMVGLLVRL